MPLRAYGLLVLLGIVAGILLAIRRAIEAGLEVDDVLGLALWVIPGGAIGGRLFYVVEYWDERIRQPDTWDTIRTALAFTEGGLVVYGAFLGAMAGFALYVWRHKLPALAMADIMAPAMMVGLALGRIGCLLNGCCYGGESDCAVGDHVSARERPVNAEPRLCRAGERGAVLRVSRRRESGGAGETARRS